MKVLLKTPVLNNVIKKKIREKLNQAFGANFHEVVIGGAALNKGRRNILQQNRLSFFNRLRHD
jgi:long-chain acyl-CoA synthetase